MTTPFAYDSDNNPEINIPVVKRESEAANPPRKMSREDTIRRYDRG